MEAEALAEAYHLLFPRRLRHAHMALVTWAEGANPDGWPVPDDVCRFAKLYGVRRATLGTLVGLLSRQQLGVRSTLWVDAVRQPERACAAVIRQHDHDVVTAFGWFCHTTDLGWTNVRSAALH
ncbi:MAG: hypothetical protein AAGK00_13595 [Pseudomonadota bacterium]